MNNSQKAEWIREGNKAFNEKNFPKAREYFIKADYKGGLLRLGDYYMFEKKLPLLAYGYYKKANAYQKIEELHQRMLLALLEWIGHDRLKESLPSSSNINQRVDNSEEITVNVHPKLRQQALSILKAHS